MRVKLTLLDRIPHLGYDKTVPVSLAGSKYEYIGTCTVFKDADGNHFGVLELDRGVDGDLYFYYTNTVGIKDVFWFSGLQLNENEINGSPTTRLKQMIID